MSDLSAENKDDALVLPVLMKGINLVTDEEFYKTLAEKVIVTLTKNLKDYVSWVKQDTPIYVKGMQTDPTDTMPMVVVGNICHPQKMPDLFNAGQNINDCTFATDAPYVPLSMDLPILSLVVNSAIRQDKEKVITEVLRSVMITFDYMPKQQVLNWKYNGYRVEVLFSDELVGGENLFMTMGEEGLPGGIALMAHWIS